MINRFTWYLFQIILTPRVVRHPGFCWVCGAERERECGKSLRRLDSLARFANLCWGEWDGAEGAPQFICNRNMYLVSLVCFIMESLFSDSTKDLNRIASKEGAWSKVFGVRTGRCSCFVIWCQMSKLNFYFWRDLFQTLTTAILWRSRSERGASPVSCGTSRVRAPT